MNTPATVPGAAGAAGAPGAPAADPLAALRGLHLPDAVGLWPPAPGWWVALGLAIALLALTFAWIRWRRASLAHHALRELDQLADTNRGAADLQSFAMGVTLLLRRVALKRFGRARVASLHGDAWQRFLCETSVRATRRRIGIGEESGRILALAPYVPPGAMTLHVGETTLDRGILLVAAKNWIRWNT